ncbi:MAG: recombinase zinc beta ribbon domain-containing protein [Acidimicrobiales bacterium]|nr:recombinase zinc beta ribbon domain-containing protein [Acidimicrobiales bacterium]
MLRNAYYTGLVTWGEIQARGNHEPLISVETYAKNQAILESHRSGEKQRTHPHYLRSTIYCRRCGSRLCFTRATGSKGGIYDYYFCLGRHQKRTECDLPFIPVETTENEIEAHYASVQWLSDEQLARLRDRFDAVLEARTQQAGTVTSRQQKRIKRLNAQRDKLLDAFLNAYVPVEVLKRALRISAGSDAGE